MCTRGHFGCRCCSSSVRGRRLANSRLCGDLPPVSRGATPDAGDCRQPVAPLLPAPHSLLPGRLQALLVITLLICINALYVAAEFAAVSVRTSRIQHQAERGGALARRLLPFLRSPHSLDRYIAACQIGITVSSLLLGAYGQITLSAYLAPGLVRLGGLQQAASETGAAVIVLMGLTATQVVFGELIPKSLALQYPTRIALWTVIPMQWSLRAMSWFIHVLNGSGAALLRLAGFEQSGHRHIHSPDELELLIAESRDGGLLEPAESKRLRGALRLGLRRAAQVMTPRIHIDALDVKTPFAEVLSTVASSPYTRIPVHEDTIDSILGYVHSKDVARAAAAGTPGSISELLRPVLFVPSSTSLDRLLIRLREARQQFAIVLDEFGGTAGLVSVEDVLSGVVGDIARDLVPPERQPERLPDGRIRVPGDLAVEDLESLVGSRWSEGEATTIAGRIVEAMRRIPQSGERLTLHGVAVEVERMDRHTIVSVLVTPPRPTAAQDRVD